MGSDNHEIASLLRRIAQLEEAVTLLSKRIGDISFDTIMKRLARVETRLGYHDEHISALFNCSEAQTEEYDQRIDCAFERVKALEVAIYPNLRNDIGSIYRIIGGDGIGMTPNPLDRRKP